MKLNRRNFLKASGITAVCACAGTASMNGCSMITGISDTPRAPEGSFSVNGSTITMELDKITALKNAGGSVKLEAALDGKEPVKIIVIRADESMFKAYADSCTHGNRELEYDFTGKKLKCVSFGRSEFDLKGKVIKDPAEKDISAYPVTVDGKKLIIAVS